MIEANPFEDPFFAEHLNPLCLNQLKDFHEALQKAEKNPDKTQAENNLVEFALRKVFLEIYQNFSPKIEGKVFLLSCISSDGLGDFFALHQTAKFLKTHFPKLDVEVIYTYERDLPTLDLSQYSLTKEKQHAFYKGKKILEAVLEKKPLPNFEEELKTLNEQVTKTELDYEIVAKKHQFAADALKDLLEELKSQRDEMNLMASTKKRGEKLYQELKNSLAIIHMALALNTFDNPELAGKSFYFAETGNFQGIANCLKYNWFSMGLQPFEEGVFLGNENLKEVSTDNESYYLCYLTRLSKQKESYLYLVSLLEQDKKNNLLIFMTPFPKGELPNWDKKFLASIGISQIISISSLGENAEIIARSGKTLKIYYTLPLAKEDFDFLMQLSQGPVGCTGDLSLSQVLSLGKIPFYEFRSHKIELLLAFRGIALFLKCEKVADYLECLLDLEADSISTAKKMAKLILDKDFKEQWEKILLYLRGFFSFEKALLAHLNRYFLHILYPDLRDLEKKLINQFLNEKTPLKELYSLLDRELNRKR